MVGVKIALFACLLTIPFASCDTGGPTSTIELASGNGGGEPGGDGQEECAFTQGYWKNHPEAWPVSSLPLGTVTYTKAQLLAILQTPVRGNGLVALVHQLIAAKLNVANGADDSDIEDEIEDADDLIGGLVSPPVGSGYLHPSETSSLVDELDGFNNTGECKDGGGPSCGNGHVEDGEECDDGNTNDGDGCSSDCKVCPLPPPPPPPLPPPPPPSCGNGVPEDGEECDDGNTNDGDGCSSDCKSCPA